MDRLELVVRQRQADERWKRVLGVEVPLERIQTGTHLIHGWRNEDRFTRVAPTEPVLRGPELPGREVLASDPREQHPMQLAEESEAQGQFSPGVQPALQRLAR